MKYVLDSSVAFKTVVTESDSAKANQLIDDYRSGIQELIAPDVLPIELGHALTRAERMGRVPTPDGFKLWSTLMADCPLLFASLPLMPRAYALSSAARIGIYDCLYVALSEQEGCEVVTDDARLVSLFPTQAILLSTL
jgi:predicted nucleic acid-binding protein